MRGTKAILAVVALAAIVGLIPAANAQVKFLGVGSSAMFTGSAVGTFNDVCSTRTGSDCHHYSVGGAAPDGLNFAQGVDSRNGSIPVEGGNLWVVWDNNTSPVTIWAYLTVDSVVGNRCFFATPRCTLQVDSAVLTTAGQNKISSLLFFNKQTGMNQGDDASLPNSVFSAVQTSFTAALTDIRPEDGKFATNRILAAYNANNLNGLGYGTVSANCPGATSKIGCPILSSFSSAKATPVQFSLSAGLDPFTGLKVPASVTIPIGAAPIIFVYNKTGPGLSGGGFTDITFTLAGQVFDGAKGLASDLPGGVGSNPLTVLLREPLSGTMNTTEFTTFRLALAPKYLPATNSQEKGINLAVGTCPGLGCPNPLDLASTDGGVRMRGIGTGQIISGNGKGVGGILNIPDSIGYTFFSYGNVKPIAAVANYVTLDGVDGIAPLSSGGVIPTCTAPCPVAPGTSYAHLRDGSYRAWSILRCVTDKTGPNFDGASAVVTATQNEINKTVPDFVPAVPTTDGDPGMAYYRSHFKPSGVSTKVNDGNGAGVEAGGDVGGCPFQKATQPNQLCFRLNGTKASTSEPVPCNYPLNVATACSLAPGH